MTLDTLGEFIAAIEAGGDLVRIKEPVRAKLELSEISDRVMKQLTTEGENEDPGSHGARPWPPPARLAG